MASISTGQLLEQLTWRYAVKKFDPTQKIDADTWYALERSMVLSPSSYGLQPWQFWVITSETVKAQLPSLSWGQKQPQDCSHMVVFAARRSVDEDYVDHYLEEVISQRSLPPGAMDGYRKILLPTIAKIDRHLDWNAKQVYLALAQFMVAAAMTGVDTCPMEGIDPEGYDRILGIQDSEYTTVVGCAAGYRHPEDAQANAAKVRFAHDEIVHRLD